MAFCYWMTGDPGIEAARLILNDCWFDEEPTYDGVDHLRAYMREWDERTQTYRNKPKHDQHSHAADSFRYLALAARKAVRKSKAANKIATKGQGANYQFALDDIWDTAPVRSGRIG